MKRSLLLFLLVFALCADEPISPIPLDIEVDMPKATLGKKLFFDTILSRDNSTSCFSCHNLYDGGADAKVVSIGVEKKLGNIQSPTVLNSRYNFSQFWNGRAKDLKEQVHGPIANPAEHDMDANTIELRVNEVAEYKDLFSEIYGYGDITYAQVLEVIVEFENALVTPNAKFDKFLRGEIELSESEKEGYVLFKKNGCITCHNGINVGGNSFQKMGTFMEYHEDSSYPDRSDVTQDPSHKNVFKVPTLRNISKTAPYFHDGSAKTLQEALGVMSKHNLGIILKEDEIENMIAFLRTLDGELPKILNIK